MAIVDTQGKQVAGLPPIQAWDSANRHSEDPEDGPARIGGTYTLAREGDS